MRKELLNTQYLRGNPSMNKGENHGARVENFHLVEEIAGPLSKNKGSTITTLSHK